MAGSTLQQGLMQLEQEYARKKADLIQSMCSPQNTSWGGVPAPANQSPAPAPAQNVSWITVNGVQGAKEHIVPANGTHWLMDSSDSIFYIKSSDEFGVSKQMKAFRFEEIDLSSLAAPTAPAPEPIDTSMYVQRAEFDKLKEKIEQLTSKKSAKAVKEDAENG